MENTIRIRVNGQEIEARQGATILEAVHEAGVDHIPTLCHSPELKPYGSCFVCTVEVKGRRNLVPSCATRVAPDMEIVTRSERVIKSRRTALELLMSNHWADCVSPCSLACPADVDCQGYLTLAALGEDKAAIDLIREVNPLPAICGRVCVRKCELACRREDVDKEPVGINAIKRHVSDAPGIYDEDPEREPDRGMSVAIVGSGPAGLTAAYYLGRKGYNPVIYEAQERTGGMLRYGIPSYRLPDDVIDKEVDYIRRAGVDIRTGVAIGRDISLDELRKEHKAVFLAVGAQTGKPMRVEGEFDTEGVVTGADFLRDKTNDPTPVKGTVVVVGGGNTAMDVARTSWRLGAEKVIVLYRRTRAEMPADKMEIVDLLEEGIELMELAAPVGIVAEQGRITGFNCIRMELGEPDASGRRRPVPKEGSEFVLPCELAVSAIGQDTVLDGVTETEGSELELTRWKTYIVNPETMATNISGVFAGGDAADDGPTVAVDAVRDGRRAALAIHSWLSGEAAPKKPFVVRKDFWEAPKPEDFAVVRNGERREVHQIDVAERANCFCEVASGFSEEDVLHEQARCLCCGCVRFHDCELRLLAEEYDVDMDHFKGEVKKHKVDYRDDRIVYDANKCILCARCIRTCGQLLPSVALGLVDRGFDTEMQPAMEDPLAQTTCVHCGNCVDACPTAALSIMHPFPARASLHKETVQSHCGSCSLNCALSIETIANEHPVVRGAEPGDYLCHNGRFANELFLRTPRVVTPTVDGSNASLEEAIQAAAEKLQQTVREHGVDKVAVFVSPELSSEAQFIAARVAREGLGTSRVGSLSQLSGGLGGELSEQLGFTASTCTEEALAEADLILCDAVHLEQDHLPLQARVLEAVRSGASLVLRGAYSEAFQKMAGQVFEPKHGESATMWGAVIRALRDMGHSLETLEGADAFLAADGAEFALLADRAGVSAEELQKLARRLARARRIVIIHGADRNSEGAGVPRQLANLALLLNAAGCRAELMLPRDAANMAALSLTGVDARYAPGRKPLDQALQPADLHKLLYAGELKAALILGENPLADSELAAALGKLECLVVLDWARTETARKAHVLLPGTTWMEESGTRVDYAGRVVQSVSAVAPPAGRCTWQILAALAVAFGLNCEQQHLAKVTSQLADLVREQADGRLSFLWNTGEDREWQGEGRLAPVENTPARAPGVPMTALAAWKQSKLGEAGN